MIRQGLPSGPVRHECLSYFHTLKAGRWVYIYTLPQGREALSRPHATRRFTRNIPPKNRDKWP